MHIVFQAGQSKGLDAVYHFRFTGAENADATVTIRNQSLDVRSGLIGRADCSITADAKTWLAFLRKETGIVRALLTRRIRVKGRFSLLPAFGRCFPS
jgi:adhesin HecA-like repeat protein